MPLHAPACHAAGANSLTSADNFQGRQTQAICAVSESVNQATLLLGHVG